MSQPTKKQKAVQKQYDFSKPYDLAEAVDILKKTSTVKFDPSVDIAVRLGVDPKKPEQNIRTTISLPHGTGKIPTILALCPPDKEQEAKEAGADHVGLQEYVDKISQGWHDVDIVVTTPSLMAQVGKLGKFLGPQGLMPNPKTGTVTTNVGKAIQEIKAGKTTVKTDKYGIVHSSVGRLSFAPAQLEVNVKEFIQTLMRAKPHTVKGTYLKSVVLSTTMGKGIQLNQQTLTTT